MAGGGKKLVCAWLGRLDYAAALARQLEVREALRRDEGPEHLLLLEHPHVYTLGRNATRADVLWDGAELARRGVEVHETDRGGQVTYHGPGQLVGYPILDLAPDRRDVRRYVRDLSAVLVETLADLGVTAVAGEGERIGLWCGDRGDLKIASIGIHLSRWITTHGFALNVDPDLSLYSGIVACGMPRARTTSIAREAGAAPGLEEVAAMVASRFARRFEREPEPVGLTLDAATAAGPSGAAVALAKAP